MQDGLKARLWALAAALLLLGALTARSEEPTPEQKSFWEGFKKIAKAGDSEKSLNYVRRNREAGTDAFDYYFLSFAVGGEEAVDPALLKDLAKYLEEANKNGYFTYKMEAYLALPPQSRESWAQAWKQFGEGLKAFTEAKDDNNPYKMDEAQNSFKQVVEIYANIGDVLAQAQMLEHLADTYEFFENGYDACVQYKKIVDLYAGLPEKQHDFPLTPPGEEQVAAKLKTYLDKGYDPSKPRDQGGEPDLEALKAKEEQQQAAAAKVEENAFRRANFSLVKEGPGEDWPLKYTEMKTPDEFVTPGFNSGFQPFLWGQFCYDSQKAPDGQQCVPFFGNEYFYYGFYSKQMNITFDENKFYLDIAGEKKTRKQIKATTRPGPFVMEDIDKGPDGKPRAYQFFLQLMGDKEVRFGFEQNNTLPDPVTMIGLRIRTGCYTKGKVLGENFVFLDDNCTGSFGDNYSKDQDTITHGAYPYAVLDAAQYGKEKIARPFSQYMKLGDKWYFLNWDIAGDKVTTSEVKVETGTCRLKWEGEMKPLYMVLHLLDSNNPNFYINVADPDGNPVELPIGEYEIACGKIETLKKGQSKLVRILNGKFRPMQVFEGKETVLSLGAPFTFTFNTDSGQGLYSVVGKSIQIWGCGGELYTVFFDEVPQPLVSIRDKASRKLLLRNDKMKLAARDDYYNDYMCVWYPLDYVYENKTGAELEAKIEAKKVPFLGGPVTSDWY